MKNLDPISPTLARTSGEHITRTVLAGRSDSVEGRRAQGSFLGASQDFQTTRYLGSPADEKIVVQVVQLRAISASKSLSLLAFNLDASQILNRKIERREGRAVSLVD